MPIVEVRELCKEYRMGDQTVAALRGVSLTFEQGSFVAIMGASGSGKSTLLHLLGGLDLPTSGSVIIEGRDLAAMSDRERTLFRRRRLGVIFQSFNLLPTLTAVENVALPYLVDGAATAGDSYARAAKLLDDVDMGHRTTHRPQALSGGEQQRVAIARALLNEPAVLLADEPTGNLDSDHASTIWSLLSALSREQNRTVIAITHEPIGARHADRIVVLKDGAVAGEIDNSGESDASLVATRYAELVS